MQKTYTTNNFEETRELGRKLAKDTENLQVLALHGDLGSGKTTFVQGFADGLGITKKIVSPTFIIMRTYELKDHQTKKFFYHVDLYRIKSEQDIEGLGLFEIIQDPSSIVLVEWPEKIESSLPENRIDLVFKYIDENIREITIG